MPGPKSSEKKSKTAYERCLSKLPSRLAKQREISSAEAIGDLCQPSSSKDNRISEEDKMGVFSVDPEAGPSHRSTEKTGSVMGNTVSETVQGDAKGVLRRPTVVNRLESLNLGRGRGRGTNLAMDNKVVGAQNGTEGILVSDSGVKKGEIINIKPRIKRVTSATNQGAVHKCNSVKESASVGTYKQVAAVGTSELGQNSVRREPPVGNIAVGTPEQIQNGEMDKQSAENASLVNLESRISTLEMEVRNDLSMILQLISMKIKSSRLRFRLG